MTTIRFPWPERTLWPNARPHWRTLRKAQGNYRSTAWALARAVPVKQAPGIPVDVSLTFCPPTLRSFDLDNALAAMKAGIDGLALAMDTDDKHFGFRIARGEKTPGGAVIVEVSA